jgi:gentisate 1,2-dioxygenase
MEGMNYISLFKVDRYSCKHARHHECASGYPFIGIGLLVSGSAVFTSHNGARIKLEAGDAIYIPKGQIYYSDWTGSPDISFYSISFDYAQQHTAAHYFPMQKFSCSDELFDAVREMHSMLRSEPDDAYRALGRFYSLYPSIKKALS